MRLFDVVILGAGPAGLSAAIYSARAKAKTLVVSGPMPGGQISQTYEVENYPGFPDGITGSELTDRFMAQAKKYGAEVSEGTATAIDLGVSPYKVTVDGEDVGARSFIIATGMAHRKLGVLGESQLMGRGVFVCATCDAALYEGLRVAVVGGGDSAVQEAIDLAKFADSVTVIHRGNALRGDQYLVDKAKANSKIAWMPGSRVEEIFGEKRVEGVRVRGIASGGETTVLVDGVLVAVGYTPNTGIFVGQLELDPEGYVVARGPFTGRPGVFVAGDIADRVYRQVVTGCASGCVAALEAVKYLEKESTPG